MVWCGILGVLRRPTVLRYEDFNACFTRDWALVCTSICEQRQRDSFARGAFVSSEFCDLSEACCSSTALHIHNLLG
jgi:hypothetical protein